MRSHLIQGIVANENAEIRVDTRMRTEVKIEANRVDLFVLNKKRRETILTEVGITGQDRLQTVETEKKRKYDILADKLRAE